MARGRYVDLPEGQVHIRETEGDAPPTIFFHQTASSAGSYVPLMRALALPNRLIAIDTPGFGGSDNPTGRPSMADYVYTMRATLDALGVDEVVSMLRAWRGRAQAYGAVARRDDHATAQRVTIPVLLLTSPNDFFHATFDRATRLFPAAHVATTAGGNFQPAADPHGVARAIEAFLLKIGR